MNALVHRDYQSPTDIQIRIYDSSISFFNPSGLFGNITVEDLKTDTYQASTRNKQIAEAFYLTNEIEKYGSGFIRVRDAITDYPTMKFEYSNLGHGFLTQFSYTKQKISTIVSYEIDEEIKKRTENFTENFTENLRYIFESIKNNPTISFDELSEKIGISRRSIINNTNKLKSLGILQRIGPDKGGHWKITKNNDTE